MALAQVDSAANLYANNFRTDGYIKYAVKLNKTELDNVQKSWDDKMSTWKTPVLDQNSEFHEFGMPLTDAQFIENRKFQVEEICRIFAMDPSQIGHVEAGRATGTNEEEKGRKYVTSAILPLAIAFEQEFNAKALRVTERNQYSFKADLNGLMRGNLEARAAYYTQAINAGWMLPDQVRSLEDLSPLPADQHGGEVRINMGTVLGSDYKAYIESIINRASQGGTNANAEA
jgi:HK97 family phage portal protein